MTGRRTSAVRLYRWGALLLPPGARADADEMASVLDAALEDSPDRGRRLGHLARAFVRLPAVVGVEWWEYLGTHRSRETRSGGMGRVKNIRLAIRTLSKSPAFSVTSILLVAVGVGAVTTIFTLVDHVLLRPLPYPAQDRLLVVEEGSHSGPMFRAMQEMGTVEAWGAVTLDDVNLIGAGDPLTLKQARVSRDFFPLLGARVRRGRLFLEDDFQAANSVILDFGAWQRIWGGDDGIVGQSIELDGAPVTVVGVLDPAFVPPEGLVGRPADVWRPLDWSLESMTRHDYFLLEVVARTPPGTPTEAVQSELDGVVEGMSGLHENYRHEDGSPRHLPLVSLSEYTVGHVRTGLGLLLGAVGLLLLVACANVAHLFLARGLGRTREMAVRRALGADTGSLVGQLFAESLIVGLAGGAVGTLLAFGGIQVFVALNPSALPRQATVALDPRVLAFAVAVSALTSLVFGLVPALRSVRVQLADELRGSGRSATSGRGVILARNGLVAAEVALSLVLVAGAGLLLRSFLAVGAQDPGIDVADVWTVPLTPTEASSPEEYVELMAGIEAAMAAVPGVRSATHGLTMPLEETGGGRCCWRTTLDVDGRDDVSPWMHPVSQPYFTTLGLRMEAGRSWGPDETRVDPLPGVLNATAARDLYGSAEAALGRSFTFRDHEVSVVGVAADTRHYGLDRDHGPALYIPIERIPFNIPQAHFAVKIEPWAAAGMPRALREAVWQAAPRLPVARVQTLQQWMDRSTAGRRFDSLIFGTFAALALLLAAGGLYGTLLYMAGQRRRELGIRLALGASRRRIEGQVLRAGIGLGAAGVVLGLVGAWITGRFLESRIWGVERGDPLTLLGAAVLLLGTAALASWLPARRAGRVDPVRTLRVE